MIQGVLFDWGGVLHDDNGVITGAASCLHWLNQHQLPWRIISNTTTKPPQVLIDKLAQMGVSADEQQVLTPLTACRIWLREQATQARVAPLALFTADAVLPMFREFDLLAPDAEQGAGSVIIGDLGEGWDYHQINRALRLLLAQPTPHFITLGATRYWQAADGVRIDVGPIAAALQCASGIKPLTLGKPAAEFFALAQRQLGIEPDAILMVGDDIESDIHGAQRFGLKTALVRTGKFRPADLDSAIKPDVVLDSIAALPAWLQRQR